jgi:hypothetical protein
MRYSVSDIGIRAGVYFDRFSGDGIMAVQKIVKQNWDNNRLKLNFFSACCSCGNLTELQLSILNSKFI